MDHEMMNTFSDKPMLSADYAALLASVKARVLAAQYEAFKAVNKELVVLYWDIGRMIVERQANAEHGSAIAEQLASDLHAEFPGIKGFSRRNVFYGWTHNLIILQHCIMRIFRKTDNFNE